MSNNEKQQKDYHLTMSYLIKNIGVTMSNNEKQQKDYHLTVSHF